MTGSRRIATPRILKDEDHITLTFRRSSLSSKAQVTLKESLKAEVLPKEPSYSGPYIYRPLENSQIRLLRLYPGRGPNIKCEIIHHNSKTEFRYYEALSYSWGVPQLTRKIQCGVKEKKYVSVTENAYQALLRLRNPERPRDIWIDAVCIDQQNIAERNHQVGLMTKIYESASSTVVFVGEPDEESNVAMRFLTKYSNAKALASAKNPSVLLISCQEIAAMNIFLDRPWFNRIWVLQEVLLAKDAYVLCGRYKVPWLNLMQACLEFMNSSSGMLHLPPAIMCDQFERRLWNLLCSTRQCASTDPRDKVYALLSLVWADSRFPHVLVADYNTPTRTLFINIARVLLKQVGLTFLLAAQHFTTDFELPSWVPDWSMRFDTARILRASESRSKILGSLRMQRNSGVESSTLPKIISAPIPLLKVSAVFLGKILALDDVQDLVGDNVEERLKMVGRNFRDASGDMLKVRTRIGQKCKCCPLLQNGTSVEILLCEVLTGSFEGSATDLLWRTVTGGLAGKPSPESQAEVSEDHQERCISRETRL
jgi:heterokaryon incompatibility protein (HET)